MSTRTPWWHSAVIYQVYLRSFADADGDGVGDIPGLRDRLHHLASLGVDALWITPWYPSPMHDGGYDVADYRDIDPLFGTLADAKELLDDAHGHGLRVIVDLVANHTSHAHPWFQEALGSPPGSAARGRYHFRDGRGPDGSSPPNDWISAFGGPAWSRVTEADGTPGQWYLHLFAPEQPDLNWDNPEVLAEFDDVLRFWLDLGIDGLRVDAASAFAKEPGLPDHGFVPGDTFSPRRWESSPLWDVDAVHDIFRRWRAIADSYPGERVFVGEITVKGPERLARYLRPDELHTAFNLDFLKSPWDPAALRENVDATLAASATVAAPATWVLSNHDETRHVTRFGRSRTGVEDQPVGLEVEPADLALGRRRARAALLLMLALPGNAYLYQGEELGLAEVEDLPGDARQDPIWRRSGGTVRGRDGCRVPLPWAGDQPPFGFGPGASAWLPQPSDWARHTVAAQNADPASMLAFYRAALHLRRALVVASPEEVRWRPSPDGVLVFDRGPDLRCVVNVAGEPFPVQEAVLISSAPLEGAALPRDTAAWLSRGAPLPDGG